MEITVEQFEKLNDDEKSLVEQIKGTEDKKGVRLYSRFRERRRGRVEGESAVGQVEENRRILRKRHIEHRYCRVAF